MKKILKKILFSILVAILILLLNIRKSEAYTAEFSDFSATSKLNEKYSFGTMFWTEKTEVIPISAPYTSTESAEKENGLYKAYGAEVNQQIKLKITNCAIDEDNDLCDVILTVTPIETLKEIRTLERWSFYLYTGEELTNFDSSGKILVNVLSITKQFNIENRTISTCNPGDLMLFDLNTIFTESKLTLDYYKAGTQNKANINGVAGFISNLNVAAEKFRQYQHEFTDFFCEGNEAVVPNCNSKIYYDSSSPKTEKSEEWGGVYATNSYVAGNWKNNSCLILEDEKSKFEMLYGGTSCGITFCFFSPYQYVTPEPNISVDKDMVYENEEYNVKVSQYVPNNYYANLVKFINLNSYYTSFKIMANVNGYKYKNLDMSKVKVYNSTDNDVSSMFDISLKNETITATLKPEYLEKMNFYNNIYYLKIPLKYIENNDNKTRKDFTVDGFSNISNEEKQAGNVETMVKIDIPIKKVWNDKNNKFNSRPNKIVVDILK